MGWAQSDQFVRVLVITRKQNAQMSGPEPMNQGRVEAKSAGNERNHASTLLSEPFEEWIRGVLREELEAFFSTPAGSHAANGNDQAELLDVDGLAKALKVPTSWVYDRTRRKKNAIPNIRVGRYPRFKLTEVIAWLEA